MHIEQEYESQLSIHGDKIQFSGLPEGYTAEIEDLKEFYSIPVKGRRADIDVWKENDITGYISIKQLMEKYQITEPAEGTYEAEVFISLAEDITITQPLKVQVKIMKVQ